MKTGPQPHKSLLPYYTFKVVGKEFQLQCNQCRQGYALPVGNEHPGNLLSQLNHARPHQQPKEK